MTPREAAEQLMRDLRADLTQVHELRDLLEQQYQSALRHDAGALQTLGERIVACVEVMEARRGRRVALARRLAGPQARMEAVFLRLGQGWGRTGQSWWLRLETLVRECKAANQRNCALLAEQHALMQGLLQPQGDLYAPA